MLKPLLLLSGATLAVAFAFPSVFQRYQAAMSDQAAREEVVAPPQTFEAAAPPPVAAGRSLRIHADPDGHFRSEVRINGRPATVLIDTGATYVSLSESQARRLGINLQPAEFRYKAQTANGESAVALTTLRSLRIGPIEIADVEAMVSKGDALPVTLLGMSFLNKLKRYGVEKDTLALVE